MKKIMIYAKHASFHKKDLTTFLLKNGAMILLFVSLICGLFTGSIIAVKAGDSDVLTFLTNQILTGELKQYLISAALFYAGLCMLLWFSGLNCLGKISQLILLYFTGLTAGSRAACFMLLYSFEGIAKYCLSVFPGTVIGICSILFLGCASQKTSDNLCYNLLTGQNEKIDLRIYLLNGIIALFFCAVGIIINIFCIKIFGSI